MRVECSNCGRTHDVSDGPWQCVYCSEVNEMSIKEMISDLANALRKVERLQDELIVSCNNLTPKKGN